MSSVKTRLLAVIDCLKANAARLPPFRFDCGSEDFLVEPNRQLHEDLTTAGIAHEYAEFSGAHTWDYWQEHIADSFRFFCTTFGQPRTACAFPVKMLRVESGFLAVSALACRQLGLWLSLVERFVRDEEVVGSESRQPDQVFELFGSKALVIVGFAAPNAPNNSRFNTDLAHSFSTMKGLYRRGDIWWFRFSHEGTQHRRSLLTTSEEEAMLKAENILYIQSAPTIPPLNLLPGQAAERIIFQGRDARHRYTSCNARIATK